MYTYKIVKENIVNGDRAKRTRQITRPTPLKIGGLYMHLGKGYPGAYRVLDLLEVWKDGALVEKKEGGLCLNCLNNF